MLSVVLKIVPDCRNLWERVNALRDLVLLDRGVPSGEGGPNFSGEGSAFPIREEEAVSRKMIMIPPRPLSQGPLRVGGYCRVSTLQEAQESSLLRQREHWAAEIQHHPGWTLADIYWESGVSGTKTEGRVELQRLMADCEAGRVDMYLSFRRNRPTVLLVA